MDTSNMDVCYIVRRGDDNEELRHSLRSVAENLPHRKIVIAGHVPKWANNVIGIQRKQDPHRKYENAELNWQAIADDSRVSDNFIVMNDDFFIMQKLDQLPLLHRGDLGAVNEHYSQYSGHYATSLKRTIDLLEQLGITNLKSYALHVPMIMNKARRKAAQGVVTAFGHQPGHVQMRTFYGNLWGVGGGEMHDVKVLAKDKVPSEKLPFISTNDQTFNDGQVGEMIRQRFSNKCKYER